MACPGGGKYEKEATACLVINEAELVCVIVLGGKRGHGFSVAASDPRMLALLSATLKSVIKQIDDSSTLEGGG